MRTTMNGWSRFGLAPLALAPLLIGAPAYAQNTVDIDLCVKEGTITLPDGTPGGTTIPIWGYVEKIEGIGCGGGKHVAQVPGPVIRAQAGDIVTIQVHNQLSVNTSILIPGQEVSVISGGTPGDFTEEATPGRQNTRYQFVAKPGTYLYESGTDPEIQVAMGLHGALVVDSGTAGRAYGQVTSEFDREAVVVLSEIDPNLNNDPAGFDLQNYHPIYWLLNGKAFPETEGILAGAGDRLLLRYANGSFTHHSMAGLDFHQDVIAREAFELPTVTQAVAEIVPAGTTLDTITTIRADAGPLGLFPLYNRNMRLTNASGSTPGGMQTSIEVQPLFFSTVGAGVNAAVPEVPAGTAGGYDDADIYKWNGREFARVFEARYAGGGTNNLMPNADIDGLKVVDADTFYVSFFVDTEVPGLGIVPDEDILLYDGGTWSVHFDGSDPAGDGSVGGLTGNAQDIDALDIDIANAITYFSINGNAPIPGVSGPFDDADIYSWDGTVFDRVFDATDDAGLPPEADIDGLKVVDADTDTYYVSFLTDITVTGLGTVQDEDVALIAGGSMVEVFIDGTAEGLDTNALDIDALDLPDGASPGA